MPKHFHDQKFTKNFVDSFKYQNTDRIEWLWVDKEVEIQDGTTGEIEGCCVVNRPIKLQDSFPRLFPLESMTSRTELQRDDVIFFVFSTLPKEVTYQDKNQLDKCRKSLEFIKDAILDESGENILESVKNSVGRHLKINKVYVLLVFNGMDFVEVNDGFKCSPSYINTAIGFCPTDSCYSWLATLKKEEASARVVDATKKAAWAVEQENEANKRENNARCCFAKYLKGLQKSNDEIAAMLNVSVQEVDNYLL